MAKDPNIDDLLKVYVAPNNLDFEIAVLSSIMGDENALPRVAKFLKPEVFYHEPHQIIYKAIQKLYKNDEPINLLTVWQQLLANNDVEKANGKEYLSTINNNYCSSAQIEYNVRILYEYYLRRQCIALDYKNTKHCRDLSYDIIETIERHIDELDKLLKFKRSQTDFKTYLKDSINIITSKKEGKSVSYWNLHDPNLASKLGLKPSTVLLIPSDKGAGKTSFMVYIVDGLLTLNKNISVLWFSLEDTIHSMICKFVSMRTNLTTKQINSENYVLTDNDNKNIAKALKEIEDFNIEFVDESSSIFDIQKIAKRFAEKNEGNDIIIVIDNFGLIDQTKMIGNSLDNEKEIVKKINYIKQETKACILVPHHITKEAISKTNYKDGYRIRDEHVKGAGEILNYFPQVISIVRPGKYPDIVQSYIKTDNNVKMTNVLFSMSSFMEHMWAIYPDGNIRDAYTLMDIVLSRHDTTANGDNVDFSFIVNAYKEYVKAINTTNMSRDDKYKSKPANIEKYLQSRMYLQNSNNDILPFDSYYYNSITNRPNIKDLFLVEIIRDRYGNNNLIFRYAHKLCYNQFYPF